MKCVLKTNDGVMIKSIDTANTTLELTTDVSEAYNYVNGEWFAKSELEFLQFHFKKDYPQVMEMHCEWVKENNNNEENSSSMFTYQEAPMPIGEPVEIQNRVDEEEEVEEEELDEPINPNVYTIEIDHTVGDYNAADVVNTIETVDNTGPNLTFTNVLF